MAGVVPPTVRQRIHQLNDRLYIMGQLYPSVKGDLDYEERFLIYRKETAEEIAGILSDDSK